MLRRRRRPPVLAEIPGPRGEEARPGSLSRSELEAFGALLSTIRDSRAVLATGEEAKLSLALGLATAAAVEGGRAALVECDLASPALAAKLGLVAAPGLHEYLRGEAEAPQILQSLVLAGPASGRATPPLVCVTAGAPTTEGPTLLASGAFSHAIAKLRSAYDLVVLDGPSLEDPALPAVAAQADAALASVASSASRKRFPIAIRGLAVQG